MIVKLTSGEMAVCTMVATLRSTISRESNTKDQRYDDKMSGYEIDLIGIIAEMAFCKAYNLFPEMTAFPRKGGHDAIYRGKTIDIKGTKVKSGRLLATINKKSQPSDIYVLGIVDGDTVEFKGYATKDDLFNESRKIDLGHGLGYAIPAKELKPIFK